MIHWEKLTTENQLNVIDEASEKINVVIFKHSTRCSISDAALNRFERGWKDEYNSKFKCYYLDLIAFRNISNTIAKRYL